MIDRNQFEQRIAEKMAKQKRQMRLVFFVVSVFLFFLFLYPQRDHDPWRRAGP